MAPLHLNFPLCSLLVQKQQPHARHDLSSEHKRMCKIKKKKLIDSNDICIFTFMLNVYSTRFEHCGNLVEKLFPRFFFQCNEKFDRQKKKQASLSPVYNLFECNDCIAIYKIINSVNSANKNVFVRT